MDIKVFVFVLIICFLPNSKQSPYRSRSKNRNSAPTYDQKQTGEYNIQLHLKDFEIVALLSDSAFGDLGDYEYNYDYSDITVKPGVHQSTTKRPTSLSTPTTPSTTTSIEPTKAPTVEPKPSETPILEPNAVVTEEASTVKLESDPEVNVTKEVLEKTSNVSTEIFVKGPIESLTILDNKDMEVNQEEEHMPIVVHRKCASGFTRDKMGRCRRVRRPQPPFSFGISRLATLASKLRQKNESETIENSSAEDQ